jgi:hypothetical protein
MLTSLLATRMRTEDKLPAAEKLDRLGFWSLEMSCPADVLVGYFSKTACHMTVRRRGLASAALSELKLDRSLRFVPRIQSCFIGNDNA